MRARVGHAVGCEAQRATRLSLQHASRPIPAGYSGMVVGTVAGSERPRWRGPRVPFLLALLVGLLSFMACLGSASDVEVLLIGDSITEGVVSGPEARARACVQERCWPVRLAALLGDDHRVINRGVGGATTRDWTGLTVGIPFAEIDDSRAPLFEGIPESELDADIVVILLGTNDAIGFLEAAPIPPDEYARNLELLTRRVLDRGAGQVVLVPPPPQHHAPVAVQLRLVGYRVAIEGLCRAMSSERSADRPAVLCGPDLLDQLGPQDFEKNDVHPNAAGHQRIAEAVAETIEALSRGRRPEPESRESPESTE